MEGNIPDFSLFRVVSLAKLAIQLGTANKSANPLIGNLSKLGGLSTWLSPLTAGLLWAYATD
ncbi:hypothetical protein [Spirosoma areae]